MIIWKLFPHSRIKRVIQCRNYTTNIPLFPYVNFEWIIPSSDLRGITCRKGHSWDKSLWLEVGGVGGCCVKINRNQPIVVVKFLSHCDNSLLVVIHLNDIIIHCQSTVMLAGTQLYVRSNKGIMYAWWCRYCCLLSSSSCCCCIPFILPSRPWVGLKISQILINTYFPSVLWCGLALAGCSWFKKYTWKTILIIILQEWNMFVSFNSEQQNSFTHF